MSKSTLYRGVSESLTLFDWYKTDPSRTASPKGLVSLSACFSRSISEVDIEYRCFFDLPPPSILYQPQMRRNWEKMTLPRNISHIVPAKSLAVPASGNPTWPVAPPRLIVTTFPLDWQVLMSEARKEQSARAEPANTFPYELHILKSYQYIAPAQDSIILTFEKSTCGFPSTPKKT